MGEKRRQNGEGSVFQVSENKWVAKIYLGTGLDGKWQTKQFSGRTEAIVKKKLRDYKKSAEYLEGHRAVEICKQFCLSSSPPRTNMRGRLDHAQRRISFLLWRAWWI